MDTARRTLDPAAVPGTHVGGAILLHTEHAVKESPPPLRPVPGHHAPTPHAAPRWSRREPGSRRHSGSPRSHSGPAALAEPRMLTSVPV